MSNRKSSTAGDHNALVVGASCAGAGRRRLHLRAEGSRLRHQRSRRVRCGRKDPAAQRGLGFEQSETHAPDRAGDLGCRLSEAVGDAACQRVRRAASRRTAGHESRGVLREPATRQSWLTGIDEPAPGGESFMDLYRRVCGGIEKINAEQRAGTSSPSHMAARSRPPSRLPSAVSRTRAWPSTSTIAR